MCIVSLVQHDLLIKNEDLVFTVQCVVCSFQNVQWVLNSRLFIICGVQNVQYVQLIKMKSVVFSSQCVECVLSVVGANLSGQCVVCNMFGVQCVICVVCSVQRETEKKDSYYLGKFMRLTNVQFVVYSLQSVWVDEKFTASCVVCNVQNVQSKQIKNSCVMRSVHCANLLEIQCDGCSVQCVEKVACVVVKYLERSGQCVLCRM